MIRERGTVKCGFHLLAIYFSRTGLKKCSLTTAVHYRVRNQVLQSFNNLLSKIYFMHAYNIYEEKSTFYSLG